MIPTLAGVHHLKLPVSDLTRSIEWYASRLGYQVVIEFRKHDRRTEVTMMHPDGGPELGLTLDPDRARAAAGFDYFSIGVPDRAGLDQLAAHLTALGEEHAGVHFATIGWILPLLHDPDGHEVRFYSVESHTTLDPDAPLTADDAIATARVGEAEWLAAQGSVLRRSTDPCHERVGPSVRAPRAIAYRGDRLAVLVIEPRRLGEPHSSGRRGRRTELGSSAHEWNLPASAGRSSTDSA